MDLLSDVVNNVFKDIPPVILFNEEDANIIISHKEVLLSITDKLVKDFYDVLFAHPATAAVFREGERPIREGTLRDWWIRTVSGPFNEEYWKWQAYVWSCSLPAKHFEQHDDGDVGLDCGASYLPIDGEDA